MNIDVFDRKLLSELQKNARLGWVKLSKRVNLSPSACQRRVEALQAAGVIKRFTIEIDPEKIGRMIHAIISVKVERQNIETANAFRSRISASPEVQGFYKLSGNIDYLLNITVADIRALSDFIDNRLLSQNGVVDASSAIVLDDLPCAALPAA